MVDLNIIYNDLNIIPIKNNTKTPALSSWKKYQNNKYPRELLQKFKNCNYAVICGKVSQNLVVIDIDHEIIYHKFFETINTLTTKTPSGGYHLYFYADNLPNKILKFNGYPIDIISEGGYVIIPPSSLNGVEYSFVKNTSIKKIEDIKNLLEHHLPKTNIRKTYIEDIKKKLSISDVIQKYVKNERQGKGYWQGKCPFHNDNDPSFTVYEDNFFCFGCNEQGDAFTFIQKIKNIEFKDAVSYLCSEYNLQDPFKKNDIDENNGFFDGEQPNRRKIVDYILQKYRIKTTTDNKEVFVYQDGIYSNEGDILIEKEIQNIFKNKELTATIHFVNEIVGNIKRETYIKRDLFDINKEITNIKNGLFDTNIMKLKAHTPNYLSLCQLPVNYDPNTQCPNIKKFLSELGDEDVRNHLLELAGYCLIPGNWEQKAFMLYGEGNNGKTTFLNLLIALLGKENVSSMTLQQLCDDKFAKSALFGKLANICADLPKKGLKDTGFFKALVGGDLVSADVKFKTPFEFYNRAKLIFSANILPDTPDTTEAFERRWILINFKNNFKGKENKNLINELTTDEELSGFLNLCIPALIKIKEKGLMETHDNIKKWKEQSNNIYEFIDTHLDLSKINAVITMKNMYDKYLSFCDTGNMDAHSKKRFNDDFQKITKRIITRPTVGDKRERCWKGIGWKE